MNPPSKAQIVTRGRSSSKKEGLLLTAKMKEGVLRLKAVRPQEWYSKTTSNLQARLLTLQ